VNERPITALQAGNFCSAGVPEQQTNTQMHAAECLRMRTALLPLQCSAWTFQLPTHIYINIYVYMCVYGVCVAQAAGGDVEFHVYRWSCIHDWVHSRGHCQHGDHWLSGACAVQTEPDGSVVSACHRTAPWTLSSAQLVASTCRGRTTFSRCRSRPGPASLPSSTSVSKIHD
jgi:hypothetical protein